EALVLGFVPENFAVVAAGLSRSNVNLPGSQPLHVNRRKTVCFASGRKGTAPHLSRASRCGRFLSRFPDFPFTRSGPFVEAGFVRDCRASCAAASLSRAPIPRAQT